MYADMRNNMVIIITQVHSAHCLRMEISKKLKDVDIRNRRIEKVLGERNDHRGNPRMTFEMPIGYYKDMSRASQEWLDKDEID